MRVAKIDLKILGLDAKELKQKLEREIAGFIGDPDFYYQHFPFVKVCWYREKKILRIEEMTFPGDDDSFMVITEIIEKITKTKWEDWDYVLDYGESYCYALLE